MVSTNIKFVRVISKNPNLIASLCPYAMRIMVGCGDTANGYRVVGLTVQLP